jgi:pyrimidine deaminase RibD-like protein
MSPKDKTMTDEDYMRLALKLGHSQMGRTSPNPAVGCVIVREGVIIAEGKTGEGGRPHAEEVALRHLGGKAHGATAYVTLEPCAARSNGGLSCSQRLIEAGVKRVLFACFDPSPFASGAGITMMKAANIQVEAGLLQDEALVLINDFVQTLGMTNKGEP